MPGLFENSQVGKREDLADFIALVDAKSIPVTSMIPKGYAPGNTLLEWQADAYDAPSFDGVVDGTDVTDFENAAKNRAILSNHVQIFRKTAKVSTLAQEVSNVAGVKDEMARSVSKKIVEIKRSIEAAICSDVDAQAESGGVPYRTRGLGKWISNTAQDVLPVPAAYRTPTGSINTTATSSLAEGDVQTVLRSIFGQTGDRREYDMPCGTVLKRTFTDFTRYASGTNAYQSFRTFNADTSDKSIVSTIDVFEGDFGILRLHPSLWLANDQAAAVQAARGYVLDMNLLQLRYSKMPTVRQLPDLGGGPRVLIEAILGLVVKNPLGLGKFAATS
jgi:hypothetical protein